MKILVTGASGFVGSAVARRLVDMGHHVRALVRNTSRLDNVKDISVEIVKGDLRDRESLSRALSGCDVLFHVAADYRLWVPDPESMYDINVKGTENIMHAALEAGVDKVVYTSSVATLGLCSDGTPAHEDYPVSFDDMVGHYKKSKFLAEQTVSEMVRSKGLPAVIVNPSTPVGPWDIKPTPTGRMVVEAASGKMPVCVDTGLNFVHVDDVAEGHLLAMERGSLGERYILGGENMTLRELLETVAGISGGRPPFCTIPHGVVYPVAFVSEMWARLTGQGEPLATMDGVKLARKKMFFSIDKASSELGYSPGSVKKALEEAIDWFRKKGYITAD